MPGGAAGGAGVVGGSVRPADQPTPGDQAARLIAVKVSSNSAQQASGAASSEAARQLSMISRAQSVQQPQQLATPTASRTASRSVQPNSTQARISDSVTALQTQTIMESRTPACPAGPVCRRLRSPVLRTDQRSGDTARSRSLRNTVSLVVAGWPSGSPSSLRDRFDCREAEPSGPAGIPTDYPVEDRRGHPTGNLADKQAGSPRGSPTDIPRDIEFDIAPRGTIINGNHSHLQWPPSSKCDFRRKIGWQTDKRWHFSAPRGRRHGLVPVEGSPRPTRFPFR